MSPYRRNILVGTTVLGALLVLGWMILKFGDRPAALFAPPQMLVHFKADRADGLGEGSAIQFKGVDVGRISTVKRTSDGLGVIIEGKLDRSPPLPANVVGLIRQISQLGGSSNMQLVLKDAQPSGTLGNGDTVDAHFEGLSLLPPEFADLATDLRLTSKQFRESQVVLHLDQQVEKVGKLIESVNQLVSDPKLREDLKTTLAQMRTASESASRIGSKLDKLTDDASATMGDVRATVKQTGGNIDTITKQVGDRLQQIATTLDHFTSIAKKLDEGKGTAGQLVNDPKLYQSLVDTAQQLNLTVSDFKRLVEQWEQEGVHFKLGGK
jgi:phospholipid/cholesterol/gamma-HCH transport system substrate-binding protein